MEINKERFFYWRDLKEVFERLYDEDFAVAKFIYNELGKLDNKKICFRVAACIALLLGVGAVVSYTYHGVIFVDKLKILAYSISSIFFLSFAIKYHWQHRRMSVDVAWMLSNDDDVIRVLSALLQIDTQLKAELRVLIPKENFPSFLRAK